MTYRLYELTVVTPSGPNTLFAALTETERRQVKSLDPAQLNNRVLLTISGSPSPTDRAKAREIFHRSHGSLVVNSTGLHA